MKIVLSGITGQPASNVTLLYQDASGDWCPLTGTGTATITYYFSGTGSACGSAPGSFSLAPGASLTVPLELVYASATYVGTQTVTATLYSGTCSSATSCTQSGALDGTVVSNSTMTVEPPARTGVTMSPLSSSTVNQGFLLPLTTTVSSATGKGLPTGTVQFLIDGTPITFTSPEESVAPLSNPAPVGARGKITGYVDTADLAPGTHTLVENYSGDGTFLPSSLTQTFTVLAPPTGTAFTCTSQNSQGTYTSSAYVTGSSSSGPTPSGGSAWVTGGTVVLNIDPTGLPSGAAFGNYPGSTFNLSPGGTMVANSSTLATSGTDDVLTWSGMSASVPVTGDPGATVPITVGAFQTVASDNFPVDCTPGSQPASLGSITVAGNTLTASPSGSAVPGAPVTLTDTVVPTPATGATGGQVTFYDGTTELGTIPVDTSGDAGQGTASLVTTTLALGEHQLSAVWSGALSIPANTSNVVGYQVGSTSTTTLTSSANPANAANPVTFTATVNGASGSPQPTGDVSFTEDGSPITLCQNVGLSTATPPTATCKLTLGAGETHSIVATYSGDATYIGSTSDPVSQVTLPGTKTTILSTKDPSPPGNVTFWAGVSPASGTGATPTGTVAFSIDGSTYKACASQPLGAGGGASCTVSFKAGTSHKVFATYAGSSSYSGSKSSTITQTVTGSKALTKPKTAGGSTTLASGKALTAGHSISVGSYKLVMQGDGNLVEYQGSRARWASGTSGHPGAGVVMQKDGNLVEYFHGKAIWSTRTAGHAGAHLTLQASDGNVVIYTPANKPVWATGT